MIAAAHDDNCIRFFDPNTSKYFLTKTKKSNSWLPTLTL